MPQRDAARAKRLEHHLRPQQVAEASRMDAVRAEHRRRAAIANSAVTRHVVDQHAIAGDAGESETE